MAILQQLRDLGQLFHRRSRYQVKMQEMAENYPEIANLPMMQKHVLRYIIHESNHHEVYQKDIEKYFYIRRSTASTILKSLEEKKMIERYPSEKDGRLKYIVVLPEVKVAFQQVYKQVEKHMEQLEKQLTANVDPDELAIFSKVLAQMKENIEQEERDE